MLFDEKILSLPRSAKRFIAVFADILICTASVHIAFFLRTNGWAGFFGPLLIPVISSIIFAIPIFILSGLYRAVFRYSGAAAITSILRAMAIYTIPFSMMFLFIGVPPIPRTLGLIQPLVMLVLVAGSRGLVSFFLGQSYLRAVAQAEMPNVVIYGAGASGRQLASALRLSGQVNVVGFIDDDANLWDSTINGLRVFEPADLPRLVARHELSDVLLAINQATRSQRSDIISRVKKSGLHIRILPGIDQLARGVVSFGDLKELEIEDLLGREAIPPDFSLLSKNVTGKVVMITGAGGSIGSEIARQTARLEPECLILIDVSEFNLFSINQELEVEREKGAISAKFVVPLLANAIDAKRIDEIVRLWKPDIIYHAAAYKHVPLVEQNIIEGISNNVFATLNMALIAKSNGVPNFVLISTDKAVRPTNIMGATKRLTEMILQSLHAVGVGTCYSMVRFGNVLGSSGSVVPIFRQQIAQGGPVTITHPEITRYFMTIPEASQLVIQSGAMASGGDVFVLDMGEPVKITDLARTMIELSGHVVRDPEEGTGDISIEFVGLRPGEKLYEELLIGENPSRSSHPRIMRAHEPFLPWVELKGELERLAKAVEDRDALRARGILKDLVPEFMYHERSVDWVVQVTRGSDRV